MFMFWTGRCSTTVGCCSSIRICIFHFGLARPHCGNLISSRRRRRGGSDAPWPVSPPNVKSLNVISCFLVGRGGRLAAGSWRLTSTKRAARSKWRRSERAASAEPPITADDSRYPTVLRPQIPSGPSHACKPTPGVVLGPDRLALSLRRGCQAGMAPTTASVGWAATGPA
jgi:hypothetical protein